MYSQNITFTGGLNTDDEDRFITDGDYRNAFYSRNYGVGTSNDGAIQSVTGNLLKSNPNLANGSNAIIGACEDPEGKYYKSGGNLILFVFNSNRQHSIWRYNTIDYTYQLILQDPILNFKLDYKIYHAAVVNGLLYWTDNYFQSYELDSFGLQDFNPPRKINIEKAIRYSDSGGTDPDGYTEITFNNLDWIKHPPLFAPDSLYSTDYTRNENYLFGRLFQFRYQYLYDDNEESAWSPISITALPQSNSYVQGVFQSLVNTYTDNQIEITLNTGSSIVKKIRVAYRINNDTEFKIYNEYDKYELGWSDYSSQNILFLNDRTGMSISNSERNYDLVPQIAKCVEYLPSNEFAIGNYIEGYDNPKKGNVLSFVIDTQSFSDTNPSAIYTVFKQGAGSASGTLEIVLTPDPTTGQSAYKWRYQVEDRIQFRIMYFNSNNPDEPIFIPRFEYVIQDSDMPTSSAANITWYVALCTTITAYINSLSLGITATFNPVNLRIEIVGPGAIATYWDTTESSGAVGVITPTQTSGNIPVFREDNSTRIFKSGATHQFAIQYYDRANRDGTVYQTDAFDVYIPFSNEYKDVTLNTIAGYDRKQIYHQSIVMAIDANFQPPSWATHYQVVYRPSTNIAAFNQRICTQVERYNDGTYGLSLSKLFFSTGATFNYTPSKGDRVRLIRKRIQPRDEFQPKWYVDGNLYPLYVAEEDNPVEYEVLSYNPSSGYDSGELIVINDFDMAIMGDYPAIFTPDDPLTQPYKIAYGGFQIEIYTPKVQMENEPWNEVGIEFEIGDAHLPTRYHKGNINQVIGTTPGQVYLNCGDVYIRQICQTTGYKDIYENYSGDAGDTSYNLFFEDASYNSFYSSKTNNKGRLAIQNELNKSIRLKTGIYHTNAFIDNTQINGLSQVEFQNQVALRDENGEINKLIQIGDTLKAFQDRKITSIYIQKTFALNGDGTNNVIISDRTFAGVRPHDDDYGCIHPGSISKYENDVFAYDYFNSSVIRITQGGIINISDKMSKFLNGIRSFTSGVNSIGYQSANIWSHVNRLHGEYALYYSNKLTIAQTGEYDIDSFKSKDQILFTGDVTDVFIPGFIFSVLGASNPQNNVVNVTVVSATYNPINNITTVVISGAEVISEPPPTLAYAVVDIIQNLTSGESIHYSFLKQRWIYRGKLPISFATQYGSLCYSTGGILSSDYGNLYEENSGGELTFFNASQNQTLTFPVNVNPTIIKRFLTFMTQSNMPFSVDVSIPATNQYPNGMASSIFVDNFNNQESYYVSKYFRDSSDPNPFLTGVLKRLNGRELRGYVLNHTLNNSDTTQKMVLMSVQCNFVPSEPILQ